MVQFQTLYPLKNWAVLKQQFNQIDGLSALAHTNALLALSSQLNQPIIQFWTLPQNCILGMMDTKLPKYEQAKAWLVHNNYTVTVRNAGGLGVVSDAGVLNISCYLPEQANSLSIDAAYELIANWLSTTFSTTTLTIRNFEVTHSYCPGRYDLSINGQKFAGIAQRRRKNGIAILLYISILGDQMNRGQLMRQFYTLGQAGQLTPWHFPTVEPTSMANLADLINQPLTIESVQRSLLNTLETHYRLNLQTDLSATIAAADYQQNWSDQLTQLARYQK